MNEQSVELLEKIRQQFNSTPYLNVPIDLSPKNNSSLLYVQNLITPYYLRNQAFPVAEGRVILDAGCGAGFKSLVLAEANPGAKIVGIDLSHESVNLAKQRLQFHGFRDAEFMVASIEDLPTLGFTFDYINCDEVLYLLPDAAKGLQAMKAVLKPDGIIRANLHSSAQRGDCFRSQQLFKLLGLMNGNPDDLEVEIARETFESLKNEIDLKVKVWQNPAQRGDVNEKDWVLANYLLQGDKGYTIADLFAALRVADLEFISMVNWCNWEILNLFKDTENLPIFWAMSLPETSIEQRLQLFELLHPAHRLLDFWCGHPGQTHAYEPVEAWTDEKWQTVKVHLHPQLKTSQLREDLIQSIQQQRSFSLGGYLPGLVKNSVTLESAVAATLLPLWDEPQTVMALMERSRQIQPLNPITLEPRDPKVIFDDLTALLTRLEVFLYILLEKP
jgi:2-polyprenyl-3-methyl-5-hydroxy-6-metoxy-1,4-benzoquinol methylase